MLVSLLLFRRVNRQSSILITEFERLLLADSSTKAKLLQALVTSINDIFEWKRNVGSVFSEEFSK